MIVKVSGRGGTLQNTKLALLNILVTDILQSIHFTGIQHLQEKTSQNRTPYQKRKSGWYNHMSFLAH